MLQFTNARRNIAISTPNVDNSVSKDSFMRDCSLEWFSDFDCKHFEHIMPISQWLLRKFCMQSGFEHVWINSFGTPFARLKGWWKIQLFALLIRLTSKCDNNLNGEILIAVPKKTTGTQ